MCWTKKGKVSLKKGPLSVWKVCIYMHDGSALPKFNKDSGVIYKTGNSYTEFLHIVDGYGDKGFHSYTDKKEAVAVLRATMMWEKTSDTVVPHCLVECEIPEGGRYDINEDGECISDSLTVKDITQWEGL